MLALGDGDIHVGPAHGLCDDARQLVDDQRKNDVASTRPAIPVHAGPKMTG